MNRDEDDELMEIEKESDNEDISSEDSSPAFDPKKIDITAEQNSLSTIISMIEDEVIDLNPEFQRKGNLWSETTMSRLIESIILQIPIPAFYFDASESVNDDRWLVVDGLQRLWTLRRFVIDKDLTLKNLTLLKDLNDKKYDELDRILQRRMDRYQITTYLIKPNTSKDVRYDLFRRINTGGLVLTDQEVRHALNQGTPADYLKELSEDDRFKNIIRVGDTRMADRELILRYLAFSMKSYTEYKPPLNAFLDKAMENLKKLDDRRLEQLKENLWKALKVCQNLFGEHIFRKSISRGGYKRLNAGLFEVWTVLLGVLNDQEIDRLKSKKDDLIAEFKQCLQNDDFYKSIYEGTARKKTVTTRFKTIESLVKKYTI